MRSAYRCLNNGLKRAGGQPHRRVLPLFIIACCLLQGCSWLAVGPRYKTPETRMPDSWYQAMQEEITSEEPHIETWWTTLGDPVLNGLVERAAAGNLSLKEAFAQINEASANYQIAQGPRLPNLDGTGAFERSRSSEDFGPRSRDNQLTDNFYSTALQASWEVDLWGRITRSIESADASLEASVDNYRDVLVLLYAEVASSYVDVRTLQERITYAEGNAETQRKTLQLTRDRFKAEISGELDVRQAELNLARTESTIPDLQNLLAQEINRLGVLLGDLPEALYDELSKPAPIPKPENRAIPIGMPARLLRQRPDIRRAERQLAAQTARIGVAAADLLPLLQLNSTIGFEGTKDFIDHRRMVWSLQPEFNWNLFSGGQNTGQVKVERALTDQALASYELAVLSAFEDVEDSLVAYASEIERRNILARSVLAAKRSVDLVETLYKTGLTDFQNVQDTQRTLFLQQDDYAQSEGQVTKNLIGLYKALGGGWSEDDKIEYRRGILEKVKDKLNLPTGML